MKKHFFPYTYTAKKSVMLTKFFSRKIPRLFCVTIKLKSHEKAVHDYQIDIYQKSCKVALDFLSKNECLENFM